MTKLLGTFAFLLMVANSMAQTKPLSIQKKIDSARLQTDSIRNLPPLEVRSVRASENSPFAISNLNKSSIQQLNYGQDLPFVLQNTPSVVVNSDAGTGVGYTGLRIRGSDGTRINVTLNGIPYNDAESMITYFVDLPDFSSSLNSVQIQRGVGTSTNGSGAFGATINLATNNYNPEKYLSLQSTAGSFNTLKNTLQLGTGLINNHFTIDGRVSNISSDGYMDRASSKLKSFYVSSTYWGDNSSLRLNIFSGWEKTYQSWYGVPEELLAKQRTYNPAGMEKSDAPYKNQTDNYGQTHYQLFYNKKINSKLEWNTAVFLTRGKGYYEEYKGGVLLADYVTKAPNNSTNAMRTNPYTIIDLVRRKWLDNNFYGQIASLVYEEGSNKFTLGGAWNTYDGLHYGRLPYFKYLGIQPDFNYYFNNAIKKDFNTYIKWNHQITGALSSFVDIQYRNVAHNMYGFDHNPDLMVKRNFNFLNPKAGLFYKTKHTNYYTSIAIAHKEPNRDDFEAATNEQPKQEVLTDFETGFNTKKGSFEWGANVYLMFYKDQLVLTGKINDIGAYTRINVPKSKRIGVELVESWKLNSFITSAGNITFSQNKIEAFTEFLDDYDAGGQIAIQHKNTDITLSPSLTANHSLGIQFNKKWNMNLISKYVSKQYLDNTQNESRTLKAYFLQDIHLSHNVVSKPKWAMQIQLYANNIFNKLYEPNGYTYSYVYGGATTTSNNYFPMAGRNYWISLKIDLK
jgi:iron complex outermembrane receptor protein